MKKTYNLGYARGAFFLEYDMPQNKEGKLLINEKNMELDSSKLYTMMFERVTEHIDIKIVNKIDESVDLKIRKKGQRVTETLQELCDDICKEINDKCFADE